MKYWLVFIIMFVLSSLFPARATIPEFDILNGAQMIVVSFSTSSENRQLLAELPTIEMRQRLTEYLAHRLKEKNLQVVVADRGGYLAPAAGVLPHNVVWVFVRADLTATTVDQREITVGAVGVFFRREIPQSINSYLSHKPMTFIVIEGNRGELENEAINAAQDQLEMSVIGPLISLRR